MTTYSFGVSGDLSNFRIKEYFIGYSKVLEIMEKRYNSSKYLHDFKKDGKDYTYSYCSVCDINKTKTNIPNRFFLLTSEIIYKDELESLKPYCQCLKCKSWLITKIIFPYSFYYCECLKEYNESCSAELLIYFVRLEKNKI